MSEYESAAACVCIFVLFLLLLRYLETSRLSTRLSKKVPDRVLS